MASHLTSAERDRIAQLYHQQADRKEIARSLGRHPSTIGRELRRNGAGHEYYAVQAQRQAERRRRQRPLERKMAHPEINQAVRERLAEEWAPQQIAGRMKEQDCDRRVSHQTIYAWIKQDPDRQQGGRCCGVGANAPGAENTRLRRRMPRGSAIVRKSSNSGCDWATSKAIRSWGRQARAAWRRWSAASRG